MRRLFLIALLLACSAAVSVAQEKSPAQNTTTPPATTETQQTKSEVEQALAEAKERGEKVLAQCIVDCGEGAITDGVETGRAIELPKPEFPPIARQAHVSGAVEVKLIIGVDGNVIAASAISGPPLLIAAAVGAARNARFTPTKVNGVPVKVVGVITYNFIL